MQDEYFWIVQYPDGHTISQLQSDGTEIAFSKEYEQSPFIFVWMPVKEHKPIVSVSIEGEKRLIYFRRRIGQLHLSTGRHEIIRTIYACGWQQTVEGRNVKSINWVDPHTNKVHNGDEIYIK